MTTNQQNLQNLSLHQSQQSVTNFPTYLGNALMSNTNPMLASYPMATARHEEPQMSGAEQLEAKYRSDMMSLTDDNKGKLDDVEFWQGLAQTYMGPTTYSNIAKAKRQGAELGQHEKGQQSKLDEDVKGDQETQGAFDLGTSADMFEKFADSSEYTFDERNPLKDKFDDPFQEGLKRLEAGDIPSAALLFEAAVQKEPENSLAWRYLGTTQAQNEKDKSAIAALGQCLKLDPADLQAHLSISVSLVNEYKKGLACEHLLLWLRNNERYRNIASNLTEFQALQVDKFSNLYDESNTIGASDVKSTADNKWDYVRVRFFEAARMSPQNPDPDVQTALGLLYSLSSDYDRAIDCFRSALSVRPEDSLIWNRLGATLANSNRNEEAVVAYKRALELSPGSLRSRYNLAVSLVQLSCYEAATKQLLQILNIQAAGVGAKSASLPRARVVTSSSIWNTLRTTVTLMNRPDLYPIIDGRDLAECNAKLICKRQRE